VDRGDSFPNTVPSLFILDKDFTRMANILRLPLTPSLGTEDEF
jgi:hypothetical protein